jgi:hypothetical protein
MMHTAERGLRGLATLLLTAAMQRVSNHTPPIAQRRFRLQISLRMLLALMFLVGVGLTIFRWPWVEVDQIVEYTGSGRELATIERRITYRRNWRAEKVKNGLSQSFVENRLQSEEHYYEGEFHGAQRYYDRQGRLTIENTYHNGQRHGLCRIGTGLTWIAAGSFANGKRHGEWKFVVERDEQFTWNYDSIIDAGNPNALFPLADKPFTRSGSTASGMAVGGGARRTHRSTALSMQRMNWFVGTTNQL